MSRQARLGLLIIAATLLFVAMLFLLARRTTVFGETFLLEAEFGYVGGLRPGAPVQYRGIEIGAVEAVALPAVPGEPVVVRMLIKQEARPLLRVDSRARIKADGVLGNQIVTLTAGTDSMPAIQDHTRLSGDDFVEIGDVIEAALRAAAVIDTVVQSVNRVLADVESGKGTLGRLVSDPELYETSLRLAGRAGNTLDGVDTQIQALAQRIDSTLDGLDQLVERADRGEGSLAQLLNDPTLYRELVSVSRDVDRLIDRLDGLTSDSEIAVDWGILTLRRAAENMAALRRHRLFRRYFSDSQRNPVDETFEALEKQRLELREREARLRGWDSVSTTRADTLSGAPNARFD